MSIDPNQIDWVYVERSLEEGTYSGYKFAVIESEKILRNVLQQKYPIKKMGDAFTQFGKTTNFPEALRYIQSMYQKIIDDPGFDISIEDAQNILKGYYQIISELSKKEAAPTTLQDKIKRYFHKILNENIYIRYLVFFLLTVISVVAIANTNMGNQAASMAVASANFTFFKIIVPIICIAIPLLLVVYYLRKKKEKTR